MSHASCLPVLLKSAFLAALALGAVSCSEPRARKEWELPVSTPFSRAVAVDDTYLFVNVTLAPGHKVADIFDLAVFGPVTARTTADDARNMLGPPIRSATDLFGETWSAWKLPRSTVKVGCEFGCSGPTPQQCRWQSVSYPTSLATFLAPIQSVLSTARQVSSTPLARPVEVEVHDAMEFLSIRPDGSVHWRTAKALLRAGPPPIGKCP
jgi:hypothetical protein